MEDDIVDDDDLARLDTGARQVTGTENGTNGSSSRAVQQPKPQSLGPRASASVVLVSPRQKGNPALNHIRSVGWEYSDIPADFVLGATTCALFLSLKYHRLHPEYIYTRIKALGGRYNLRIILVLVDIDNHEDPLKELSKTSLINNVTVILSWSSQEAGRYLELYKNYEHAAPTSIKGIQSTTYSDQLVDFITVPRGINKTDAVSLVATFGSIKTAINARPEEVELISGWGNKKVQRWYKTLREPFRNRKAKHRSLVKEGSGLVPGLSRDGTTDSATPARSRGTSAVDVPIAARLDVGGALANMTSTANTSGDATSDADHRPETRLAEQSPTWQPRAEPGETVAANEAAPQANLAAETAQPRKRPREEALEDGVAAALSKLRKT